MAFCLVTSLLELDKLLVKMSPASGTFVWMRGGHMCVELTVV